MTQWSAEQIANANVIQAVGRKMGATDRDIQIALMTAMQESGLRNLNYGDRDSLGLFQQRPSQGWGTATQVRDPQYAAQKFDDALFGVSNRNGMALTQAAQAVQRSAYPSAYAKWEGQAASLIGNITAMSSTGNTTTVTPRAVPVIETESGVSPLAEAPKAAGTETPTALGVVSADKTALGVGTDVQAQTPQQQGALTALDKNAYNHIASGAADAGTAMSNQAGGLLAEARRYIGTPYVWGGTSPLGLDCSGFTQRVFAQMGVQLPRVSYQQAQMGQAVSLKDLQPGDLVFTDYSNRNPGADHVGIYMGNNQVIEAWQNTGVGIHAFDSGWWANQQNISARRVL